MSEERPKYPVDSAKTTIKVEVIVKDKEGNIKYEVAQ